MSDEELKELTKLATKLLDDLGYVAPELRRARAMSALLMLMDEVMTEGTPRLQP